MVAVLVNFTVQEKSKFINDKNDAKQICDTILENCDTLESICLSENSYAVEACNEISKAVETCKCLKVFDISNTFTRRTGPEITSSLTHYSAALSKLENIREFNISDNAIGPLALPGLETFIKSPVFSKMEVLNFSNTGLGPLGSKMLYEYWPKGTNCELKILNVSRNRLGDLGAAEIAKIISILKNLEFIEIKGNSIPDVGMKALCLSFIGVSETLEHVDISDNNMNPVGAQTLALAVSCLRKLKYLNVGDNLVGSALSTLGFALCYTGVHLTELFLNNCGLTRKFIMEFIDCLVSDSSRSRKCFADKIDLNGNEFGQSGIDEVRTRLIYEASFSSDQIGSFSEDDLDEEPPERLQPIFDLSKSRLCILRECFCAGYTPLLQSICDRMLAGLLPDYSNNLCVKNANSILVMSQLIKSEDKDESVIPSEFLDCFYKLMSTAMKGNVIPPRILPTFQVFLQKNRRMFKRSDDLSKVVGKFSQLKI